MGHSAYQVSVCAFNRGKLKVSIFSRRLCYKYNYTSLRDKEFLLEEKALKIPESYFSHLCYGENSGYLAGLL
jgi:hypothetical protein